nr:MAG TPA: hypothetical protein [Caudoviricetes sp.]
MGRKEISNEQIDTRSIKDIFRLKLWQRNN